tara:strand:- start:1305 stop:1631 length:327 start_codon:yes stop_codon:yes gene_type:complete
MTYTYLPSRSDAVRSLQPSALFVDQGTFIQWLPDNKATEVTEDQINTELTRIRAEYAGLKYQRDRKNAYPSLGDFADAMYWNSKGDASKLTAYYAACEKVKTDNPKPS